MPDISLTEPKLSISSFLLWAARSFGGPPNKLSERLPPARLSERGSADHFAISAGYRTSRRDIATLARFEPVAHVNARRRFGRSLGFRRRRLRRRGPRFALRAGTWCSRMRLGAVDHFVDLLSHRLAFPIERDLLFTDCDQREIANLVPWTHALVLGADLLAHDCGGSIQKIHHAVEKGQWRHGLGRRRWRSLHHHGRIAVLGEQHLVGDFGIAGSGD